MNRFRRLMGQVDAGTLLSLALILIIATLTFSFAQLLSSETVMDQRTVTSLRDLADIYFADREEVYQVIIPESFMQAKTIEKAVKDMGWAVQARPGWYWQFGEGTYYFDDNSSLSRQVAHDTEIVVYEDILAEEVIVASRAPDGVLSEELILKAPHWPKQDKDEQFGGYLVRELSKRRVLCQFTLKSKTLAEQEMLNPPGGGIMLLMGYSGGSSDVEIIEVQPQGTNFQLLVGYPEIYSNTTWEVYSFDVDGCITGSTNMPSIPETNMPHTTQTLGVVFSGIDSFWDIAETNLLFTGATRTVWVDTGQMGRSNPATVYNRFYGLGNGGIDTDEDDLPDARERFAYNTDPENSDSDNDGATDGQEISAGTDPLYDSGDTDGDGLHDDLEVYLGTSTNSQDSDLDWASDAYEYQEGTDPLYRYSTPELRMVVNDDEIYTRIALLSLSFPGIVADTVILADNKDMLNCTTGVFNQTFPFVLNDLTNGWKNLYCQLERLADTRKCRLTSRSFVFDNTPPTFQWVAPTNQARTDRRWIAITGEVLDEDDSASVVVDGKWADQFVTNHFVYDRYILTNGTNKIIITASDLAGNVATQIVEIIQDTSGDTNAPSLGMDFPLDFEISGGTTSWFNRTTLGLTETAFVEGDIDDETALVQLFSIQGDTTNGPHEAFNAGTQYWGQVPLEAGSNLVYAIAWDAAGNCSTATHVIVSSTSTYFEITSPEAYSIINSTSVYVEGVASLGFLTATISVNGVEADISSSASNITFSATCPVSLGTERMRLVAKAEFDGTVRYADPQIGFYDIREWEQGWHEYKVYMGLLESGPPWVYCDTYQEDHLVKHWTADTLIYQEHSWGYAPEDHLECNTPITSWDTNETSHAVSPPRGISLQYFGVDYSLSPTWMIWDWIWDGKFTFIKQTPTQEWQHVIFQFEQFDYGRNPNESIDPTEIIYRGQTGFWYNGRVSFLIPIQTCKEYTMSVGDFKVPSYSYYESWNKTFYYGNWVRFKSFTNDELSVDLSDPGLLAFTNQSANTQFLLTPDSWTNCIWSIEPDLGASGARFASSEYGAGSATTAEGTSVWVTAGSVCTSYLIRASAVEETNCMDVGAFVVNREIAWTPPGSDIYVWEPVADEQFEAEFIAMLTSPSQGWSTNSTTWFRDPSTNDEDCGTCTLSNLKSMTNGGIVVLLAHGNTSVIEVARFSSSNSAAVWMAGENDMFLTYTGSAWSVRATSDWFEENWKAALDSRHSLVFLEVCHSADGLDSVASSVGGETVFAVHDEVPGFLVDASFSMLVERMNGTDHLGEPWQRKAADAYGSLNISETVLLEGRGRTTFCPSPQSIFPRNSPEVETGWGAVVFDTYMSASSSANQAVYPTEGHLESRYWTVDLSTYEAYAVSFQHGGTGVTVYVDAEACVSLSETPGCGKELDGDSVAPNGDSIDDWSW